MPWPPSRRLLLALLACSLLLPAAIAVSLVSVRAAGTSPAPVAGSNLVLHPRTTDVRGALAGGIDITGSLYPTIPGTNAIRLAWRATGPLPHSLTLTAEMPGMRMVPSQVTLQLRKRGFSGSIVLPMFGHYQLTVTARTRHGLWRARFGLELPLPRT